MKKLLFSSACLLLLITSCKKTTPDPAPAPVAATPFMTYASGTTWDYQTTDNVTTTVTPYTLTATSVDTAIGSKTYRVFNSVDANGTTEAYYNQTGNDYYEFTQLSAQLPPIDMKYLSTSAAVGTTWSQPISVTDSASGVTITANIKSTILDTGFVETVNSITYNRVIRIKTEITNLATNNPFVTATVESQNISACYAPKYGLIKRAFALHIIANSPIGAIDVINNNTTNILMHSSIQ